VAQQTQAELLVVVDHSDVKAGELAVVGKMGEACFCSQVFRAQRRKHSDALSDLAQTSGPLLAHSFSAGYSMKGRTVSVAGRDMQELQEEDAMNSGTVVDSM
jgi:hypothetical protein